MNLNSASAQFFLRIALSISFLSAVADRFGLWGAAGTNGVNWGNWQAFVAYSCSVTSFVSTNLGRWMAIFATTLEIALPILLIIGYKTKFAAFTAGLLLLSFALSMTYSFGIKPSLDYSVWTGAAASFLLCSIRSYSYSLDKIFILKNEK